MPATTDRTYARLTGILYLVTHVTSVAAVAVYATGALVTGVALEFVLALGCAGTGLLLWVLLRGRGPARAATFAVLRTVEASVILAGTLPMLALARLGATDPAITAAMDATHAASFLVGQGLVIGVNTVVLAWLLWDARAVPRALAALGIVGGALVLASDLAQLFGAIAPSGPVAAVCAVPVFAFEIWFALFLIVRGLRPARMPADVKRVDAAPARS